MRILLLLGATFFFSVSINGKILQWILHNEPIVAYEQCENGGTPINSTACQCPAFVAGERCEIVK